MDPHWYLLNYIAPSMRRRETLAATIDSFNDANKTSLQFFLPEFVEATPKDNGLRLVNRPLIYHYIFLHGTLPLLKQLCIASQGFSFVIHHGEDDPARRYVTVPDTTLQSFRIIARHYANRLPYYSPRDIDLLEGDEVEVVSGDFAGLRGIFIARKGTSDGHIVVMADQQVGSIAYNIKADSIRILRFSPNTRRAYDQIDAFIPRLRRALQAHAADRPLTPDESAPLHVFTRRYSATEVPNAKFDAKLQFLLWAAHTILGNADEAAAARARYVRRAPDITNPKTQSLLHEIESLLLP